MINKSQTVSGPALQPANLIVATGISNCRRTALLDPLVARIAKGGAFVSTRQGLRLGDVRYVTGRADHAVYQTAVGVNTDMRFHAKVQLVAFLALMHLGITFPLPIFGRGWGGNQRGMMVPSRRNRPRSARRALIA